MRVCVSRERQAIIDSTELCAILSQITSGPEKLSTLLTLKSEEEECEGRLLTESYLISLVDK